MRAAVVTEFGGPEAVTIADAEVPEPGAGQVRIKVDAAALNPVDGGTRAGVFGAAAGGPYTGLGWDAAGTVDAAGAGAGFAAGDAVVALVHGVAKPLGSHAEYVVVDAAAVAPAPTTVDAVHAATLPLNALAADQALGLLDPAPGSSLLVTGAAGALGAYAVQLAVDRGVSVTGLARESDEELVRSLGAAFTTAPAPAGHDAVLDAAVLGGAQTLRWTRDGGALAAVIPHTAPAPVRAIRTAALDVRADGPRLAELTRLVDAGTLTLRVAETYALTDAPKAHARLAEGGIRGRLVLVP
ncbi:zinc-binding dehydrogenase [Streptomyces sp. WMMC500]|uniref:zinc-binding dehydrogenase n=1 Tax=Streptomyces sp. WMMC500 TaxID=3015154 RepID=UPI00248B0A63|nr:zinc-binding dehydrogenase [Streptomyces sp. WMMC500]WBB63143.1 zinc-binding dehydrogenase [Streptomyces sp. WMMC500]